VSAFALALALVAASALSAWAQPPEPREPPYSCRLLYAEQKKQAYGDRSNGREIERLTKECLRDGGRP
jgi:hypothetical protein